LVRSFSTYFIVGAEQNYWDWTVLALLSTMLETEMKSRPCFISLYL